MPFQMTNQTLTSPLTDLGHSPPNKKEATYPFLPPKDKEFVKKPGKTMTNVNKVKENRALIRKEGFIQKLCDYFHSEKPIKSLRYLQV